MTLQELIVRIKAIVLELGGPESSAMLEPTFVTEILLPRVFQIITQESVSDPHKLNSLRADSTITLTNGIGDLPAGVEEEYAEAMFIKDGGLFNFASLVPQYMDYVNDGDTMFDRFYVGEGKIYFSGQDSGNITLSAILIPQLPTLETDPIVINAELLEKVIALTSGIIRGEVSLTRVGLDSTTSPQTSVG